MLAVLRTLRAIQWGMLASVIVYAFIGEVAGGRGISRNPTLNYILSTISVAVVGMIFVVRRTLVLRSEASLAAHPDDGLSLSHWKNGYIATYALCESLAVFGLIQRLAGFTFAQSVPFYLGGFVMLFFFAPRQPLTT
jgi:hypothetical protein